MHRMFLNETQIVLYLYVWCKYTLLFLYHMQQLEKKYSLYSVIINQDSYETLKKQQIESCQAFVPLNYKQVIPVV